MTLLSIEGLRVEYPSRHGVFVAVDGANLTVEPGEIHGLVGESGAGKSTVGAAIMGLIEKPGRIADGTIKLKEEVISGQDEEGMRALRGNRISMIFQDPLTSLNPLFTVREQLTETIREHLDVSSNEADARALDLLNRVGIPDAEIRLENYPHQFSGGMRQRIVIALALCSEPEVIIADEPTTALDVSIQAQVLELIKDLARERQVGVILITHDMGVIAETTSRVTVMYKGQVVESGTTKKILTAPEHLYTQSLISAVPRATTKLYRFPLISYGEREADFQIEQIKGNWQAEVSPQDLPLLKVEGITKTFLKSGSILPSRRQYFTAVDEVSFEIQPGEVFGIVGESGSGKSTVARVISGLLRANGGAVEFEGRDVTAAGRGVPEWYRREIQMIFQDPYSSLNPRMRVDKIVAEPAKHLGLLQGSALQDRVYELLDMVGLGTAAGRKYPHEFSGGQRQRISIARALATQPKFLICDEPTSALDVSVQAQILNILKDLQEHLNLTMLFISHDLPVVRQMCDRVAVMKQGRIVESSETGQLFDAPRDAYTQELLRLMPKFDSVAV